MTSIGMGKASRDVTKRLRLTTLFKTITGSMGWPSKPCSNDGYLRFSSLSPYRPSFSNPYAQPVVGSDCLRVDVMLPLIGLVIASPPLFDRTFTIVFILMLILGLTLVWYIGRDFKNVSNNLIISFVKDHLEFGKQLEDAPHILTCSHGIIRYRFKVPPMVKVTLPDDYESKVYAALDVQILELLETDPALDLSKYASGLCIELVDFQRKGLLGPSPNSRIFILEGTIISYELKDNAKSYEEIEQELRLILAAHPSADLNALANDLGITIRNIQRRIEKGDEGFPTYDLPIGTKSP